MRTTSRAAAPHSRCPFPIPHSLLLDSPPSRPYLSIRVPSRKVVAVAGILLSTFLAAAESTVIATAMPSVVADLGGLELYGWVGAMYMLAMTITIPIWGKMADLWGRKPVILAGIATFLVAPQ